MGNFIDLTGQTIGRWSVIQMLGRNEVGASQWLCRCACGVERSVTMQSLNRGRSSSCGCLMREKASIRFATHGLSKSKMYDIWEGMIQRCTNPRNRAYRNYGARGISVCPQWRASFEVFLKDMGEAPPKMTLERQEVNGNYEASNCIWASRKEQNRNKRTNFMVELNGITKPLVVWCEEVGVNYQTAYMRIQRGWSIDRSLTPVQQRSATRGA